MGKHLMCVVMLVAACGGEEAPSCQQAMAGYYGAGCTFVDLTQNNRPIPQGEATANCQGLAGDVSGACSDALDDWLVCLKDATPASQCDCSSEQMALIQCQ